MGLFNFFTQEIAMDLGTANTLIIHNDEVVVNEPSIIALNRNNMKEVLGVGKKALLMHEKTHESIKTIRPLKDGVIADFNAAELMIRELMKMIYPKKPLFPPSWRMVICIPSSITEVEKRAVRDSADDIALYKMVNTPQEIIDAMPAVKVNFDILPDSQDHFYGLQSSPTSEVGKLLNKAQIDGFTEHFSIFSERIGGNYVLEGLRYLIKGYFRFGSSGAPYLVYNSEQNEFEVNAIQSEACPIQLSISNKRDGNFQYVNAIATPLSNIKVQLEKLLK